MKLSALRMSVAIPSKFGLCFALLLLGGALRAEGITEAEAVASVAPGEWRLVYTRQPRANTPVTGTVVEEAANWQHASDVGRINTGLAEADVVIDDLNGNVKVIYNCTTSKLICVAHEARVSPDGTKIVYSVGKGDSFHPVSVEGIPLGLQDIPGLTSARLW
ncbi:MAG: hypothetical protein AB8C02_14885, partial [Halioglobus sp.]